MAKKRKKADAPEVCENCRWWRPLCDTGTLSDYDPETHKGSGECWRYPPTVVARPGVDPYEDAYGMQPEVGALCRCGEFEMMREQRRTD